MDGARRRTARPPASSWPPAAAAGQHLTVQGVSSMMNAEVARGNIAGAIKLVHRLLDNKDALFTLSEKADLLHGLLRLARTTGDADLARKTLGEAHTPSHTPWVWLEGWGLGGSGRGVGWVRGLLHG